MGTVPGTWGLSLLCKITFFADRNGSNDTLSEIFVLLLSQNKQEMASISDIIMQQVKASAGNVSVPSNIKDKVVGGLKDSILGSLTQTATKSGGIEQISQLLTGKTKAESSPVTALATQLFAKNVTSKLGLSSDTGSAFSNLIPKVMGNISGFIKDKDGDGDLNDILLSLKGEKSAEKSSGSSILGAATSILGGFLKKK